MFRYVLTLIFRLKSFLIKGYEHDAVSLKSLDLSSDNTPDSGIDTVSGNIDAKEKAENEYSAREKEDFQTKIWAVGKNNSSLFPIS